MAEIVKYNLMKEDGASPEDISRAMFEDGLTWSECIRTLRQLFDLDLVAAKELAIVASGLAESLEQHQENIAKVIQKELGLSDEDLAKQ